MDIQQWRRKRMAALAERAGGNAALGKRLGYRDGAFVGQMIKGLRPISEKTVMAAEKLPGFAGWFQVPSQLERPNLILHKPETAGPAAPPSAADQSGDYVIHQYAAGGAMGRGLVLEALPPGVIRSWQVDPEWLRLNVPHHTGVQNLRIVTGFGPSMRGMFNPGDPLLCDCGVTTVDIDGVFFFRVGDHGFIKLLQRIPTDSGVILRAKSKNPDYEPFDITARMEASGEFQVFGRILTVWKSEHH